MFCWSTLPMGSEVVLFALINTIWYPSPQPRKITITCHHPLVGNKIGHVLLGPCQGWIFSHNMIYVCPSPISKNDIFSSKYSENFLFLSIFPPPTPYNCSFSQQIIIFFPQPANNSYFFLGWGPGGKMKCIHPWSL